MAFNGANALSDIVDSFVQGIFYSEYGAFGHGKSYWRRNNFNEVEAFADMFAIMNKPQAKAWAEKNIPNLWAAFIAKMEDFNNDT